MRVHDAIYGQFELPDFIERLVLSPEFRRLSEVRLININSASLAALADVRRYSHTLGVLYLLLKNPLPSLGEDEYRALMAALIVHDAGTPAFAHLFEYFLTDRYNWDHESVVPLLLRGEHHTDRNMHQIFSSHGPKFERLCRESKVDFEIVLSMIEGRHPASKLIFGSLDFDNIDNVARMNWMLGHRFDVDSLVNLASSLDLGPGGQLCLPREQESNLQLWGELRRRAYEVLVYDGPTVAGQAVLSRAIADALEDGTLSDVDWHYNDMDLIRTVREHSHKGKLRLEQDFFGPPPATLLMLRLDDCSDLEGRSREALTEDIEEFLRVRFRVSRPYGYVFRDRGTFSKRVEIFDPGSRQSWAFGQRSSSLIIYGFGGRISAKDPAAVGREFTSWMGRNQR